MNHFLCTAAHNLSYIIRRQALHRDIEAMWSMIAEECHKLDENEYFQYAFRYFCWRFTVSGNSRRSSFDNMMYHCFELGYISEPNDIMLRDVMCLYIISSYEGDKRDCRRSDWPDADLLNSIFTDGSSIGDASGFGYFSAGA